MRNYFASKSHRQWQSLKMSMIFFGLALVLILAVYSQGQEFIVSDSVSTYTVYPEKGYLSFFGVDTLYNIKAENVRAIAIVNGLSYVMTNNPNNLIYSTEAYLTLKNRFSKVEK